MKYDSLIFDLDGTLWNPGVGVAYGWQKGVREFGLDLEVTPKDIESICGLKFEDCMRKLFPQVSESEIPVLKKILQHHEKEGVLKHDGVLYPNTVETLKKLSKEFRLFIVSNCQDWYLEHFLDLHHLRDVIEDFESYGRTGNPKWDNISSVVKRNGLKTPIYIGDTESDLDASKKAELPFILAKYGFGDFSHYLSIDFIDDLHSSDILTHSA